jgi:hypothetical protein
MIDDDLILDMNGQPVAAVPNSPEPFRAESFTDSWNNYELILRDHLRKTFAFGPHNEEWMKLENKFIAQFRNAFYSGAMALRAMILDANKLDEDSMYEKVDSINNEIDSFVSTVIKDEVSGSN